MSQFISTEHANEVFREALAGYRSDTERIKQIKEKVNSGQEVSKEDILWVCDRAQMGIWQEESSWYDHG